MVPTRTSDRTGRDSGFNGDGNGDGETTAMTRRGVLTAGAVGISGSLSAAQDGSANAVGQRPESTAIDGARGRFQTTPGGWSPTATLTAGDATPKARFGYSMATDGSHIIVGADTDDENGSDAGAAYVFAREDDSWAQTQKLTPDDAASGDRFGDVVALDEGRALIGARRSDSRGPAAGAAYVFDLDGDSWVQTQKLTADDADPNDRFGRTVALDASRALIGARIDDGAAPDAGAAYVFELVDGRWRQTQKLTAADANESDRFGDVVALGGDQALVGAGRDDEIAEDGGAVYSFKFDEGEWQQRQKLTPDDAEPGTRFGSSLALQRNVALVGAEHDSKHGKSAGAVFVFQKSENRWRQARKLAPPDPDPKDRFGSSVDLSGNLGFAGAMKDDAAVDNGGAAYVFTLDEQGADGGGSLFVVSPVAAAALGALAAAVAAAVALFGRDLSTLAAPLLDRTGDQEPPPELLSDEERVLGLLEDNGGRMKQQDVTAALDWSQTKTSNVVNDLQDDGKIEVYRLGNENTLALPGEIDV